MRILLVAMPDGMIGWDRLTKVPNLGLSSIAGSVDRGHHVKILDLNVAGRNPVSAFENILREYEPDLVGFSCMSFQYHTALGLARKTKEYRPDIHTVIGGYHPTIVYEEILDSPDMEVIDFVIRGEGEVAFNQLLKAQEGRCALDEVSGLSYKKDGCAQHNPKGKLINLAELPLPRRDLHLFSRKFHVFGMPAHAIETSRGCTKRCGFCCITNMYGRNFRRFPLKRIIDDISQMKANGIKAMVIVDDNITADNGRWFAQVCQAIIEAGHNDLHYHTQASVAGIYANPSLVPLMAKAGIKLVFLGVENSSQRTLQFLSKPEITASAAKKVISELRKHNIIVFGGFIIGNPDDTQESIWSNFYFAKELELDTAGFLILTPFPKTELRAKLLDQGLITNLDDYSTYDTFHANVRTKYLTAEELWRLREKMGFAWPLKGPFLLKNKILRNYKGFLLKMLLGQIISQPKEIIRYLIGSVRKVK
jgi:anaerobic magnesium-protoporphyrin IX monomethyl ester cyclase